MQAANPRFLFDFDSPNAYLLHQVLPAIEARTGVVFEQVPILLGGLFKRTGNRSPAQTFANVPNRRTYDRLEMQRFVARHGLTRFGPTRTGRSIRCRSCAERSRRRSSTNGCATVKSTTLSVRSVRSNTAHGSGRAQRGADGRVVDAVDQHEEHAARPA